MSWCKSCGAEILWATTPKGKSMPLNAKPEMRFLVEGGGATVKTCRLIAVRTSHFASCPNADHHRNPKTKE